MLKSQEDKASKTSVTPGKTLQAMLLKDVFISFKLPGRMDGGTIFWQPFQLRITFKYTDCAKTLLQET